MSDSSNLPTVLIVDDISANLELVTSYLKDSYHTSTAKNGTRALKRLNAIKPDLILLDIQMPEMDGYEACAKIKSDLETKDIPIIFMTALSETVDKVKGFNLGAVDYITKPVDKHELLARVHAHISLYKAQNELKEKNKMLSDHALQQKRVEQIMRHDLKSPLQAILSIPELLLMDDMLRSQEEITLLQTISCAGQKMLHMINSSLTLYKIETGNYNLIPVSVDLFSTFRSIITSVTHLNRHESYKVNLNGNLIKLSDSCAVLAEKNLIYSLFSNLLKNAEEASPHDKDISIEIETGDRVEITITNFGEVPENIRDVFFEEMATSGKAYGTGLGTYSAKLITNTLGGTISLDYSVAGQTSITVALPSA